MDSQGELLPALLKYWRKTRGLSQLDLGFAANISARHISFIETGRAKPTKETLLVIADALQIPLREQNTLLRSAGFKDNFERPSFAYLEDSPVGQAIDYMLTKHDPYPMVVMDSNYNLIKPNQSAIRILQMFVANPNAVTPPVNLLEMIFDPELSRPFIVDWEVSAHKMLARLHRETLEKRHDKELRNLLDRLLVFPGVPSSWCQPDFSFSCEPTATLTLEKDEWRFSFLMTMTSFSAPQNITLEELKIESYFPLDKSTELKCNDLLKQT